MNTRIINRITTVFLMGFLFFSLFFPVYFAQYDSPYYTELTIANIFASLFIIWTIIFHFKNYDLADKNFIIWTICLLVLYVLCSFYVNFTHFRWIWESFNFSLAVMMFLILILYGKRSLPSTEKMFSLIMGCQIVTTLIGFAVYFIGYSSILFLNGTFTATAHDLSFYEKRFSWLYYHKSQYCFILLLFIAFTVVYKKHFKNQSLFIISNLIFIAAIILSHTYTALFAAVLIYIGSFTDYIKPRLKTINKKIFIALIPIVLLILFAIYIMSRERNIWTLGGRTYIWKESIHQIIENFWGIGSDFGPSTFAVPGLSFEVYNCHNVFFNEMYRFSLPVGFLFTLIFLSILIYSLKKHFSFLNAGIWLALLCSLCMDYALLGREFSITFFYFFTIFFLPYMHTKQNSIEKSNINS